MLELNTCLRTVVEGEIDSREALRRGLDRRPEVAHDVDVWVNAWRARVTMVRIAADESHASGAPGAGHESAAAADLLARHVARLARSTGVRLDYGALRKVELPSADIVTRRFIGFGGSMPAAPLLPPLWNWVPIWRAAHTPLP